MSIIDTHYFYVKKQDTYEGLKKIIQGKIYYLLI